MAFLIRRMLHTPVMTLEVLSALKPSANQTFIDMTFGYGGHTEAILSSNDSVRVLALDRDSSVSDRMQDLRLKYGSRFIPLQGTFSQLPILLKPWNICQSSVNGIIMDLGASSMQMDSQQRGFSVSKNSILDMRMNQAEHEPIEARHVINNLDIADLTKIFRSYGEERFARPIAKAIVEYRTTVGPINYTQQLSEIVDSVVKRSPHDKLGRHSHSATKVFMALRIFVNNELNELACGLDLTYQLLVPRAPCVVISFHSLEDRIVKWIFKNRDLMRIFPDKLEPDPSFGGRWNSIGDFMTPSESEIETNPRSRSAKMRVAVKL